MVWTCTEFGRTPTPGKTAKCFECPPFVVLTIKCWIPHSFVMPSWNNFFMAEVMADVIFCLYLHLHLRVLTGMIKILTIILASNLLWVWNSVWQVSTSRRLWFSIPGGAVKVLSVPLHVIPVSVWVSSGSSAGTLQQSQTGEQGENKKIQIMTSTGES